MLHLMITCVNDKSDKYNRILVNCIKLGIFFNQIVDLL